MQTRQREFGRIWMFYVNLSQGLHNYSTLKLEKPPSSVCIRLCKHRATIFYFFLGKNLLVLLQMLQSDWLHYFLSIRQ